MTSVSGRIDWPPLPNMRCGGERNWTAISDTRPIVPPISLIALTESCVAAWIDTRKAIIPNRLNVLICALGLLASATRGGWLAAENQHVWWLFEEGTPPWAGVIAGLLFALVGFLLAFAVMFGLWIFNLCGAGDVKRTYNSPVPPGARFVFEAFELDPVRRRLTASGEPVAISERQLDVLLLLVVRAGQVVSKDDLLQAGWKDVAVGDNSLEQAISSLRRLLGTHPSGIA